MFALIQEQVRYQYLAQNETTSHESDEEAA